MKKPKQRRIKAWADIGSHGNIYFFVAGPVASRYPDLMHVFRAEKPGLVPVVITYKEPRP